MTASEITRVRHFLKVTAGPDKGKTVRLADGGCLIGRSEDAQLVLSDPDVGFQQAMVTVTPTGVFLENLSAKGTTLDAKPVTARCALAAKLIIQVSPNTQLQLESVGGAVRRTNWIVPVCIIVMLLFGVVVAVLKLQKPPRPLDPVQQEHWQNAHQRIDVRMGAWVRKGRLPADVSDMFQQAWLRENSANDVAALKLWRKLQSLMMTTHVDGAMAEAETFASHAGPSSRTLGIVMGWNRNESPYSFQWSSDEAIADAAWWFVTLRVQELRERLEAK